MDSTLENFQLNELLNCYYFSGGASCTALPFLGATCMPLVLLWELYFLLYHTFAQCKGTQISESEKFLLQESGIEENFAYRILKPRFWNPEYRYEGVWNRIMIGIRKPDSKICPGFPYTRRHT